MLLAAIRNLPFPALALILFAIGLCVGSFLNVCICRLPENESIVSPRSRCPFCRTLIRWYDNIPLLSYLFLGGRCRHCKIHISPQYPLVELMTGLFFVALYGHFQGLRLTLFFSVFVSLLIVASFVDLKYRIIPDEISLGGLAIGLVLSFWRPDLSILEAGSGALLGGGILYLLGLIYTSITGREGIGWGDIKLVAMIGAFLGVKMLLFVLLVSSGLGALMGVGLILLAGKGRTYPIPFGPYLTIGALVTLFFGHHLWRFFFPAF